MPYTSQAQHIWPRAGREGADSFNAWCSLLEDAELLNKWTARDVLPQKPKADERGLKAHHTTGTSIHAIRG